MNLSQCINNIYQKVIHILILILLIFQKKHKQSFEFILNYVGNIRQNQIELQITINKKINQYWDTVEFEFWLEDLKQIYISTFHSLIVENSFFQLAKLIYKDKENFDLNQMIDLIQQIEIDNFIKLTLQFQMFNIVLTYASGFDKARNKKKEISLFIMNIVLEYYKYVADNRFL
ncbi:unnamed protein product [Paramecium pentaurelia]|uniref:Transmembrane protein n=1 Tax=Paramecium pentaurelia TaxID=43138 RepID=A0A8S1SJV3_9CILI|nr:unnamed protein product [Paramecium pentaurelia]